MKRLFLLLAVACVGLASCSETLDAEEKNDPTKEEKKDPIEEGDGGDDNKEYTVSFKVDMRVPALDEDVINKYEDERIDLYAKFYTDLITSRLAVPNDYALTFKKDGEVVGEYKGGWNETEIALPNGTYQVTGQCDGDFNTASFSFDESITIDKNTSILMLSPSFNCWIFLFDRRVVSNAWWCNGETDELTYLNKTDELFYVFSSSWLPKLPFVLGEAANCPNLHNQIEYQDGNIWHLGVTWQDSDKNYPAKVWYYSPLAEMEIGKIYLADKNGLIVTRGLPKP